MIPHEIFSTFDTTKIDQEILTQRFRTVYYICEYFITVTVS